MFRATLAALFVGVSPHALLADGLVYRLPEDGTAAVFRMEMTQDAGDRSREVLGTLRLSSVGKDTVDGKACRWIELRLRMTEGDREQDKVAKLLIPEAELVKGGDPMSAVVRAWEKEEEDEPERMEDPASHRRPVPVFLSGPLEDAGTGDDEAVAVEGLGNLTCKTITGRGAYGDAQQLKVEFTTARSDKAPFGVAKCTMKFQHGEQRGTVELLLEKVETKAESAIPDRN